jgi:hypothetical protein
MLSGCSSGSSIASFLSRPLLPCSSSIFARWCVARCVYRHKLKSHVAADRELPSYEELRQISIDSLKKQALHCLPAAEIDVKFRQVRWTLLYQLNGYKKARGGEDDTVDRDELSRAWTGSVAGMLIPDCLERDAEGRSLHGWELKSVEDGINRKNIKRSTSISGETRYPWPSYARRPKHHA